MSTSLSSSAAAGYRLAPWAEVARPHGDVTRGALDMGTYAVNLAQVFRGDPGVPEVYTRPERFFAATYPTTGLLQLLSDVLGALSGEGGDRVLQLRTPFGGGKTHTLVALLHLARHRPAAVGTEFAVLPDPGPLKVAVLSGEELDPLSPERASGVDTRTLWGELAAQLGRYDVVAEHDRLGSAPGGDALRQVLGQGPVLILMDEVLVYAEKAMALARGDSTLGRQVMLFLQALTESVNGHTRAALVYSLQASAMEAVGAEGLLIQLDHLVSRIDAKREPVSGDEVLKVVQRRLFEDVGDPAVHRAVAVAYADLTRRHLQAEAETEDARREADLNARRLEERIVASYPFHPALLDLMYHRWGSLSSYQRTRGALQFLACVTHALWEAHSPGALIGPGEVDLSEPATRGAFFSQVGERERYTSVIDADITSGGSGAMTVDRRIGTDSPALAQLQVGTRISTAIMLYSFGTREGEDRGVLERDLVAATLVPGLDRNVIVAALHDLREEELHLHYSGRRYRFDPKYNLTKLVRDEANKLLSSEVLAAVRAALEERLGAADHVAVWPEGPGAVRDKVPAFCFVYLSPDWSAQAQPLGTFLEEAGTSKRVYRNALALVVPDQAQFDRARAAARVKLAAEGLLSRRAHHGFDAEQLDELREKALASGPDLSASLDRSYEAVVLPVRGRGGEPYELEQIDLRPLVGMGRSLNDRVIEAVANRVFRTLTVDRLVTLSGLGAGRPSIRVSDLLDAFYSFFEFTKLTEQAVLADAISRAVAEGRLGYGTGVRDNNGEHSVSDPRSVHLEEMFPAAEVDLSADGDAVLLVREVAVRLRDLAGDGRNGSGGNGGDGRNGGGGNGGDGRNGGGGNGGGGGGTGRNPSVRLRFRARVRAGGLFELARALSGLREQSAEVYVEAVVRATAKGDRGYDRVRLRNAVREPLEEGDAEIMEWGEDHD